MSDPTQTPQVKPNRLSSLPLRSWVSSIVDILSYTAAVLLLGAVVAYFAIPATFQQTLGGLAPKNTQPSPTAPVETDEKLGERARSEASSAYGDHWHVALWFASCQGLSSIDALPDILAAQLTPYGLPDWTGTKTPIDRAPSIQQREVAQLSINLYRQRIAGAAAVRSAANNSELMTWIIILLGLTTTIIVSLSSTEYGKGEERRTKLLRLFAIMLPAVGTAVAAANAFYAPSQHAVAATRTLSSLGQLHSQIALEIWTVGCPNPTDLKDPILEKTDTKIAQWVKRYQEIQSAGGTTADGPATVGASATGTASSSAGAVK